MSILVEIVNKKRQKRKELFGLGRHTQTSASKYSVNFDQTKFVLVYFDSQ